MRHTVRRLNKTWPIFLKSVAFWKIDCWPHMLVKWIRNWWLYSHVKCSWWAQKLTQKYWCTSIKPKRPACKSYFRWLSRCARCNKRSHKKKFSGFKTKHKCAAFAFSVELHAVWAGLKGEIRLILWIGHPSMYIINQWFSTGFASRQRF